MKLLDVINIPLCQQQRIPIKTLIEQLQPTSLDKKLLETHIQSMYLVSLLNEQTIRIRAFKNETYSFQAIYIFQINLKKNDNLVLLSTLIHSAFPESTILLFNYKGKQYISGASKRINKLDKTKTVIEDTVLTEIIINNDILEYLDFNKLIGINLKGYYESIMQLIYQCKVYSITNIFPAYNTNLKYIIKEYERLNFELNILKEKYKNASMKAEQIRLDDELYDKETELKELIAKLKVGG
ncbi:DUF4391 domain-containing protein [Thomasclavelia cocleata]|nr:DUF4391 domain-containing protein [Thomasclavelia cocleata]